MTHQQIVDALIALGFHSGWVVTDGEITLWENDEPQPTSQQLESAAI